MKNIIPMFTTILGVTIMTCIVICLITFQIQVTGAKNFHANCIDSIEASYGEPAVITSCINDAAEKGYTLTVTADGMYDDRPSYKVDLTYTANIVLFNLTKTSTIEGFAR